MLTLTWRLLLVDRLIGPILIFTVTDMPKHAGKQDYQQEISRDASHCKMFPVALTGSVMKEIHWQLLTSEEMLYNIIHSFYMADHNNDQY